MVQDQINLLLGTLKVIHRVIRKGTLKEALKDTHKGIFKVNP